MRDALGDTVRDTMRGPQPTRLWNGDERHRPRCDAVSQTSAQALVGGTHLPIVWSGGDPPPVLIPGERTDGRIGAPPTAGPRAAPPGRVLRLAQVGPFCARVRYHAHMIQPLDLHPSIGPSSPSPSWYQSASQECSTCRRRLLHHVVWHQTTSCRLTHLTLSPSPSPSPSSLQVMPPSGRRRPQART